MKVLNLQKIVFQTKMFNSNSIKIEFCKGKNVREIRLECFYLNGLIKIANLKI